MLKPENDADHQLASAFRRFIEAPDFPCVGAEAAIACDNIGIMVGCDINPVLPRQGTTSDAPQHSGRAVEDDGQCPPRGRPDFFDVA